MMMLLMLLMMVLLMTGMVVVKRSGRPPPHCCLSVEHLGLHRKAPKKAEHPPWRGLSEKIKLREERRDKKLTGARW